MNALAEALDRVTTRLDQLGLRYALVGGLAVSVRCEPRFTRDADLAVAVADDREAEQLVSSLLSQGYEVLASVEQEEVGRLATIRLRPPGSSAEAGLVVDLLFASSGIEEEIVNQAERLEVFTGLKLPVATTGHLIALKLLARDDSRPQDQIDLRSLSDRATALDWQLAESSVQLIQKRSFARGRALVTALRELRSR